MLVIHDILGEFLWHSDGDGDCALVFPSLSMLDALILAMLEAAAGCLFLSLAWWHTQRAQMVEVAGYVLCRAM